MINFLALELENFTSWQQCSLPLFAQGSVCIQGPTGGGKSSLWHALHYCLFGACPDPVKADEIRRSGKATMIRLTSEKDGHKYTITRYRGHSQYGNKVFFTGYGIPDVVEDSHVKTVQGLINRFLGINSALFRTTVYLAQRNFHQFHTMTEHAQKVFLESVTFGSLFERCETVTRARMHQHERELDRLQGKLQGLELSLKTLVQQARIRKQELHIQLKNLAAAIATCEATLTMLEKKRCRVSDSDVLKRESEGKISTLQQRKGEAEGDIRRYQMANQLCPRCGLVMLEALRAERLQEAESSKQKYEIMLQREEKKYADILKRYRVLVDCDAAVAREHTAIREFQRDAALLKQLFRHQRQTHELLAQRKQLRKDVSALRTKIAYQTFWVKGFGLQGLRSMVLTKALRYFTECVRSYLRRILANRIDFVCELENNRLLTSCNGRSYWALSGGERQSVDLCTGLALRDLAETYNKCRFNIAIYDEPFENFDAELTAAGQELLLTCGKPSTFLVTHRELSVRFDKVYRVTKADKYSLLRRVY